MKWGSLPQSHNVYDCGMEQTWSILQTESIHHLLRWACCKSTWNITLFFLSLVYSIFESLYPLSAILFALKHLVRSEKVLPNWKWYFKNNIIISHNCVFIVFSFFFFFFCFLLYKLLLSMWLEPYVNTDATSCGILLTILNHLSIEL